MCQTAAECANPQPAVSVNIYGAYTRLGETSRLSARKHGKSIRRVY
jgi:hypothetical protein